MSTNGTKIKPRFRSARNGFTIIELLVVISIISMLSGVLLVSMQNFRANARDARRAADMNAIVKGIQVYYDKFGQLPPVSADSCCDDWDQGPCAAEPADPFIGALQASGVTGSIPFDPGGLSPGYAPGDCYGYNYFVYPAGTAGCNIEKGSFFVLGIRNIEQTSGPSPNSPGFSCAGRDWQEEFEWVTGAFEKDF